MKRFTILSVLFSSLLLVASGCASRGHCCKSQCSDKKECAGKKDCGDCDSKVKGGASKDTKKKAMPSPAPAAPEANK